MRVFLAAVLATIILAFGALFALNTAQRTAAVAYSTEGARINPTWSWRRVLRKDHAKAGQKVNVASAVNPGAMRMDHAGDAEDACEQAGALSLLFVDFSDSATGDEGAECN